MQDQARLRLNNPNDPFISAREPAVPGKAVVDPAGWTAREMQESMQWLVELSPQEIDEIKTAVRALDY